MRTPLSAGSSSSHSSPKLYSTGLWLRHRRLPVSLVLSGLLAGLAPMMVSQMSAQNLGAIMAVEGAALANLTNDLDGDLVPQSLVVGTGQSAANAASCRGQIRRGQ